MNLLIIDDDQDDIGFFCQAVSELFPTATCSALSNCINLEKEVKQMPLQDIIFLDGHMFPISGRQCFEILHSIIDKDKTKIIIHTGSISPDEASTFTALGAFAIIKKGASYDAIKETLSDAIAGVPPDRAVSSA